MIYQSVNSSNVAKIGYDASRSRLGVIFHNGNEYHDLGVPVSTFHDFLRARSKGSFVHEKLKGHFDVVEI